MCLHICQSPEKVLWSFGNVLNDGTYPVSSLIMDSAGNLYGTTLSGGANGNAGTVFELSPQSDGTWSEAILYNFCAQPGCSDGASPLAGLVMDAAGNLYGTTERGGTQTECGPGCGTVFELSPQVGGVWTESVLYDFCSLANCSDGAAPNSQLIFDDSGNLYGTSGGGTGGVIFELSPGFAGWTEAVLYSFCSKKKGLVCIDGQSPMGGVAFDRTGNLYGTTQHGGQYQLGVVFEISPRIGNWAEKVLFSFYVNGSSVSPVAFDSAGNLYSTTLGNAFQLNATKRTVVSRIFTSSIGSSRAGVLIDPSRTTLFGVGATGGANGGGTVWRVNSARQLEPIYDFCSLTTCADGGEPSATLIKDAAGNLYGTGEGGGAYGTGVVFEITP